MYKERLDYYKKLAYLSRVDCDVYNDLLGEIAEACLYDSTMGRYEGEVLQEFDNKLQRVNSQLVRIDGTGLCQLTIDPNLLDRVHWLSSYCNLDKPVCDVMDLMSLAPENGVVYTAHNRGFVLSCDLFDFGITVVDTKFSVPSDGVEVVRLHDRVRTNFDLTTVGAGFWVDLQEVGEGLKDLTCIEVLLLGSIFLGEVENWLDLG